MAGIYETWGRSLRFSFSGLGFKAIFGAFGKVLGDRSLDDAKAAIMERLPGFASAPANSLTSNDRQLVQGPSETDANFAARLIAARDQWRLGSAPLGLLVQLHFAGFDGGVLLQQNGLGWTLTGAPVLADLVDLSALPSWCSRVELHTNPWIPPSTDGKPALAAGTHPWGVFDGGMDGNGNQWCSRFFVLFPSTAPDPVLGTAANLARIQRVIKAWRPSKASIPGIAVCTVGRCFDWPVQSFDDAGALGAPTITFYEAE
jgi:hypothetical protein